MGPKPKLPGGCDEANAAPARPQRADAQRDRARILEAAEVVFASEGIEAPVDVIAEKAGVGVGTLYRHFPTKEKLCEAILLERLAGIAAGARGLACAEDPADAFFGFLEYVVEQGCLKRDLMVAVSGAGVEFELAAAGVKEELHAAVEVLLQRAQSVGAVRPDVTAVVVMSLIWGTCQASMHAGGAPAPELLSVVFAGLRAPGDA